MLIASRICLVIAFAALVAAVAVPWMEHSEKAEARARKQAREKAEAQAKLRAASRLPEEMKEKASAKAPADPVAASHPEAHALTVAASQVPLAPNGWPVPMPPMHKIHDADWIEGEHVDAWRDSPKDCRACHGADLEGALDSRAQARRVFRLPGEERKEVVVERGERVSCSTCHENPDKTASDK